MGKQDAVETLYAQLASTLLDEIATGRHPVGALLPTEHELSAQYGVSRSTVRQALRDLEVGGLIVRQPGIGTRVVSQAPRTDYVLTGQAATEAMGYAAETRLVVRSRRDVIAKAMLAARLGTSIGSRWRVLTGLRLLVAQPAAAAIAISEIYVAAAHADLADGIETAHDPIYLVIERQRGIPIAEVHQDIAPVRLTAAQAKLLRTEPGSIGMHVTRRFLDAAGHPVEVTMNTHPADRFTFSLRLRHA